MATITFDISTIHPSLRHLYAGRVAREIHTDTGITVRVWDTCMPKDSEERAARVRETWRVADRIAANAAAAAVG